MNYPVINIYPSPTSENANSSSPSKSKEHPMPVIQLSKLAHPKLEIVPEEKEGLVSQSSIPDSLVNSSPKASSNPGSTFYLKDSVVPSVTLSGMSPAVRSNSVRDPVRSWKHSKESADSLTDLFSNSKSKIDPINPKTLRKSRSSILYSKSEELRATNVKKEEAKPEVQEATHKKEKSEAKPAKRESFLGNLFQRARKSIVAQQDNKTAQKYLVPSNSAASSNVTDRGIDYQHVPTMSNYPSYKIDKRLIFMGQAPALDWHVISYHSTFRRLWNLFLLILILYEMFWYPLAACFIPNKPWPEALLGIELASILVFLLDIVINMRTTYSNENNEEVIDSTMMRQRYTRSKRFIIDIITVIPIQEIMLFITTHAEKRWMIYSISVLVRMLRLHKVSGYMHNRFYNVFVKLFRIFIAFFMVVHWVSCIWYVIIQAEYGDTPALEDLWFANNLRMVATGDEDLLAFYSTMGVPKVYGFTLISVFMLAIGSDMAPITDLQIWLSVLIGLFGAAILAYRAGAIILTISKASEESSLYQDQLEELEKKLKINKIPHNLKVKVMEYFYYSWRKHTVLKKLDDFSELSRPLQRDIALYQYHEMIMKVPLFKELDPSEILSIIQKLKTSIYMPGDKIIREGERGTEMFIIQEGVAEMLIKTSVGKKGNQKNAKPRYQKSFLEKGSYFGEVALMSNSKRTFDVTAYEFCILLSFSKSDYNRLHTEFKDIGPRLRSGLKHYKNTHMESLVQILKNLNLFQNFTEKELARVADEYLEEIFVDPDKVVLGPKSRTNALYIMLEGMINCYEDNDETRNYLSNLKRSDTKDNWTIVGDEDEVDCLDDDILKLEKDKLSMEDQKTKLDLIYTYTYGEYFGTLDFDINEVKCDKFYVSDSGCQLGVITQSLKSQMAAEDPVLYAKLRENIIKFSPKRTIPPIEEESDSSFATKNNTIIKTKLTRPGSKTEFGKKPVLIKISAQNKEEDYVAIKEELQQLEDEVTQFTYLLGNLNAKINRSPTHAGIERNSMENLFERQQTAPKINIQTVKMSEPSDEFLQILARLEEEDQATGKQPVKDC